MSQGSAEVGLAESRVADEYDVSVVFEELQAEQVLDLQSVDL